MTKTLLFFSSHQVFLLMIHQSHMLARPSQELSCLNFNQLADSKFFNLLKLSQVEAGQQKIHHLGNHLSVADSRFQKNTGQYYLLIEIPLYLQLYLSCQVFYSLCQNPSAAFLHLPMQYSPTDQQHSCTLEAQLIGIEIFSSKETLFMGEGRSHLNQAQLVLRPIDQLRRLQLCFYLLHLTSIGY